VLLIVDGAILLISILAFLISHNIYSFIVASLSLLVLIAGSTLAERIEKKDKVNRENFVAQTKLNWERQMGNWDKLFYCSRCDHVHRSDTRQAVPIASMHSLI
jgi:hypothetical protein